MSDSAGQPNPLMVAMREAPLGRALDAVGKLRQHWVQNGVEPFPVPLVASDPHLPRRSWLPEPDWMSGADAFNIFRLQSMEIAQTLARLCQIIADQYDREDCGLNYAMDLMPPNHSLLADFEVGSNQWFRALYSVLTMWGADEIEGWEGYVEDLQEWLHWRDHLRIRLGDVIRSALSVDWPCVEYSLPEMKQNPIWSFPQAMAWIATRDFLALARLGYFRRSENDDEVAEDGVCIHNTKALGWLQTAVAFAKCSCGEFESYRWEAARHCTCLSMAWEELVRFSGGLTEQTPELVFSADEGWVSMTWPDGADGIRFIRRDILDRWPVPPAGALAMPAIEHSTAPGEQECREWLAKEFAADPEKRRSKREFREAALAAFPGRLSERGFNLRVWPDLAREHARDGAGAKKKS